mmetsp:Transcript_28312/g.32438  ORF Transcript_28312/g.32438 Transcript_28312/m.32438 type:complete len:195 (-) Transcript_28312:303-887(-)
MKMTKLKLYMRMRMILTTIFLHRKSISSALTIPQVSKLIDPTQIFRITGQSLTIRCHSCLNQNKIWKNDGSPCNFQRIKNTKRLMSSHDSQETLMNIEEKEDYDGASPTYYQSEQTIKKSRFIGIAKHCTSWDSARKFIEQIRLEHPKSRHACFGLVCGSNPKTERCSDDGEPTMGSPFFIAIITVEANRMQAN